MAGPDYMKEAFWTEVLVSSEEQVRDCLNGFDIINFKEHRTTGESVGGETHDWHIFSVVARKQALNETENWSAIDLVSSNDFRAWNFSWYYHTRQLLSY